MGRLLFFLIAGTLAAQTKHIHPTIRAAVDAVSEENIAAILKKLESFETRNPFSETDHATRGTGAARRWIHDQFQSYSPRLEVSYDTYKVKQKSRIFRDVEMVNIVAVLPGKLDPERQVIVSGHYDSAHFVYKPREGRGDSQDPPEIDHEKTVAAAAPGVTDDGSGTAAVLELARVMSRHEWDNTIVFIAFDGEEYGLVGSTLYAARAKEEGRKIEAVLNNDIIGSEVDGRGRSDNRTVRVFSADPVDSGSRQLARYIREVAERYVPSMKVDSIFQRDRFNRGGDHTPFHELGFAAVRFTTPSENYANQHTASDTFANTSPAYTAMVARVNAAALASLAMAPAAPSTTRTVTSGLSRGRPAPNISRGPAAKAYDARLRWSDSASADLAGYAVVMRSTTAPFWEKEMYVGKVTEFTLKDVSIDDKIFGVKAIDKDGNESLVSAYVMAGWPAAVWETY